MTKQGHSDSSGQALGLSRPELLYIEFSILFLEIIPPENNVGNLAFFSYPNVMAGRVAVLVWVFGSHAPQWLWLVLWLDSGGESPS